MQAFVGVGRITRDGEAKRAIEQPDNMRSLLWCETQK